jgi:hypothetical protein
MAEENGTENTNTEEVSNGENTSQSDNTAIVTFGGKQYTIERLRAGKFYSALKVYMAMVKEVAPKVTSGKDKDQEIDLNQLVTSMFESWPEKTAEFVAMCCSTAKLEDGAKPLDNKFILDNAYPEEISDAFQTCLKLNQVAKSLKNFVAPIGELGAIAQGQEKSNK